LVKLNSLTELFSTRRKTMVEALIADGILVYVYLMGIFGFTVILRATAYLLVLLGYGIYGYGIHKKELKEDLESALKPGEC
jgi:hypothetical protein